MRATVDTGFVRHKGGGEYGVNWRRVPPESVFATNRLVREIAARAGFARGVLLDIGCGTKPYRQMLAGRLTRHIGVDMPSSGHSHAGMDGHASALALPFRTASFDSVLCTEVLEHVPDPHRAYAEIARVLAPGGCALVTTPFLYRVHEAPHDFFRFTAFAHRRLAADAGLDVEEIAPRGGYPSVLTDLLVKGLRQGVSALNALIQMVLKGRGNIAETTPVRWLFAALQGPPALLLARENLNAAQYTLGYVVLLRKPRRESGARP
jgi:SAM-dependent methyltransferase